MPRKDAYHNAVRHALITDGWTITHDPYTMRRGRQTLFIDLAAEMPIAAEKEGRKIAVEVKSLIGTAEMPELEREIVQYMLYRSLLKRREPDRVLFLAVAMTAFVEHFDTAEGRDLIADDQLKLLVFRPEIEQVERWIE
jgi:hypothetical protein